jgi:hypothetical protein
MLYIFKEGSSVLFVISSAVCLPLTDLLYLIPFLTGKFAGQKFTIYDGFALFVLIMGMLVYHSEKEERQVIGTTRSIEKSPMYTSPTLQKTHLMKKRRGKIVYRQSPGPLSGGSRNTSSGSSIPLRRDLKNKYGSNAPLTSSSSSSLGKDERSTASLV